MNKYVLDSYAVLAHLEGEERGKYVTSLLEEALDEKVSLYMSVINSGGSLIIFY